MDTCSWRSNRTLIASINGLIAIRISKVFLDIRRSTLLLTSVLPIDNDLLKWVTGFIFGGGSAAAIQGGTALTRLASAKLTAGTGNVVVATGENAAAIGTSVLSLVIPLILAAVIIVVITYLLLKFGKRIFIRKKPAA